MTKKKKPYQAPADKVEKLTLIGNMGYISANESRLLAANMWNGYGDKPWKPKPTPRSYFREPAKS